ncbi:MAG: aminopeptidase [Lachnospiraceae bacterium]|nr:aminopeptidase [Lachnospiraceae bacterium]
MELKNAWLSYTQEDRQRIGELSQEYKSYLDKGKTEREFAEISVNAAKAAGYRDLNEIIRSGGRIKSGDKVYAVWMEKTVALFNIGSEPLEKGFNILGAHIDSPRLDLKQNPLYEDTELAYFDTHYYGGIKKYQWVALPLAIHGVIVRTDGTKIPVVLGEDEDEPAFCITDLLIHLAQEQMEKKGAKVVEGENLDLLIGSMPVKSSEEKEGDKKEKELVKNGVLKILKEKYGVEERDFESAELEVVPAGKARDAGLDSSMILAYGQDDRVCSYASLRAFLDVKNVKTTAVCLLVDKEEIGSVGATGMRSRFFENTVFEILELMDEKHAATELTLRRVLANSRMLSSDVSAAYDPLYAARFDKRNAAYFGKGIVFNKFTGSRGKSGSNDTNAEFFAYVRSVMDGSKVAYQTAELGKVDAGGGGTIAYIMALYGMDVVDCGMAVLSMHAPWEVTSKSDLYEGYKAYRAFIDR